MHSATGHSRRCAAVTAWSDGVYSSSRTSHSPAARVGATKAAAGCRSASVQRASVQPAVIFRKECDVKPSDSAVGEASPVDTEEAPTLQSGSWRRALGAAFTTPSLEHPPMKSNEKRGATQGYDN